VLGRRRSCGAQGGKSGDTEIAAAKQSTSVHEYLPKAASTAPPTAGLFSRNGGDDKWPGGNSRLETV
jgi:hypothetical protein